MQSYFHYYIYRTPVININRKDNTVTLALCAQDYQKVNYLYRYNS